MTEEKNVNVETATTATIVEKAKKPRKPRKPRKPVAGTTGKIPAKKPAGQEKAEAKKPAGQEKAEAKKPAEKPVSKELENMIENVSCLPSFAGREKETLALANAIIDANVEGVLKLIEILPRAEKALAMSLNNSYAQKKAAGERQKKAAVKLTREQEERALARTLWESMQEEWKSAAVVPRKGMKLKKGDLIRTAWLTWKVKAVTSEGVYCEFFEEGVPEAKGIYRHEENVIIDPPAKWPEDVQVRRLAPAPAGVAK